MEAFTKEVRAVNFYVPKTVRTEVTLGISQRDARNVHRCDGRNKIRTRCRTIGNASFHFPRAVCTSERLPWLECTKALLIRKMRSSIKPSYIRSKREEKEWKIRTNVPSCVRKWGRGRVWETLYRLSTRQPLFLLPVKEISAENGSDGDDPLVSIHKATNGSMHLQNLCNCCIWQVKSREPSTLSKKHVSSCCTSQ